MEKEAITTIVVAAAAATTTTTAVNTINNTNTTTTNNNLNNGKIKKRGALHVLKVALFMLRGGSNKKSKSVQVEVASKGLWKKLVGAMRPLHHHQLPNQNSPPRSIQTGPPTSNPKANDSFHDVLPPPMSPQLVHPDTPSSSSSVDSMSRYASAQNLQELDRTEESNNCDIVIEDDYFYGGDALIDAKAEEFIAQFYEQMRLQQLNLLNHHNERKRKKKMAEYSLEAN
ncbi:Protein of unknown function DUF761 [Macleaya cordata]|uniref:Uncharacterized protein n=1 Tax=Macleaya cordata TaxID=56857 RepID=A0A200R2A7_MACCD|nr:Protein of unknown function DUF761 [Macleaya cordata]